MRGAEESVRLATLEIVTNVELRTRFSNQLSKDTSNEFITTSVCYLHPSSCRGKKREEKKEEGRPILVVLAIRLAMHF